MAYAFALLLFILGLATGIPAIPHLLRMRKIKPDSATTDGVVHLEAGPAGGAFSSILGKVNYPQIFYRTPDKKEFTIEVVDASAFNVRRYKSGETVKVVYDKKVPSLAYLQKEWDFAVRDLWMAGGEFVVAFALWNIGVALKLPM